MPEGDSLLRLALIAVTGVALLLLRALRRAQQAPSVPATEPLAGQEDILSERLAQRAITAAHAKTAAILNATDEAIFLCDEQGFITEINQRGVEVFGHDGALALGKAAPELLFPSPMNMIFQSALDRFLGGDEQSTEATETTAFHQNGSRFAVQFTIARLELDNAGFALCIRDIDNEREAQLELERTLRQAQESQQELEQFARFAANRELKMIELKKEVNSLLGGQGSPNKYSIPDANSRAEGDAQSKETVETVDVAEGKFSSPNPDWGM